MTTLQPRPPYTTEEVKELYPPGLQLQLVQVFFRHGERTPEHARFQNTGLPAIWPYWSAAKHMVSAVMTNVESSRWGSFQWQRHLEMLEKAPTSKALESSCNMAELTDLGRQATLNLGHRLRHLYVHQLGFLPEVIRDANMVYLRSSSYPRTLESLQQVYTGLYPPGKRDPAFGRPTIVTRRPDEETLMPMRLTVNGLFNWQKRLRKGRPTDVSASRPDETDHTHARMRALGNDSPEMDYLNALLQIWMPSQRRVALDSTPKLHGIWDSINSTLATPGPPTRLPPEFYDSKARSIIDRIVTDEEYAGFKKSNEYRTLGIGALLGEVVQRMVRSPARSNDSQVSPPRGEEGAQSLDFLRDSNMDPKIALFGCHDSTLAAILASLGALEDENNTWPSYTSSLAVELFNDSEQVLSSQREHSPQPLAKKPQKYIRIQYNGRPITIPGCRPPGRHLEGDESFCNLAAFKEIVDRFTPMDWKEACVSNLDQPAFPTEDEPAGF